MAGTTPVTFENATTTSFALDANGRIVIAAQERGPRTVDMSADDLKAVARCSVPGSEAAEHFAAKANALAAMDSKTAENTLNPSTPGFKPVMKP